MEEGQLVTSPGRAGRAEGRASESPVPGPAAGSQIPASHSPAKSRNRFRSRSRSHSRSRRRRSGSRSKRRRSGSRSRSPYAGPVIRDMRRGGGRNRHNRFPRGRRPFRNQSRRSRSLSVSRSPSPSRRVSRKSGSPADQKPDQVVKNGRPESSAEKSAAAAAGAAVTAVRQMRPEDIKNQAKADTMSFLSMLHEKKQVNKMIPINLKSKSTTGNDPEGHGHTKSHGFVSTFASLAGRNQAQVDASGDEDDGWEVVDDARNSQSPHKRLTDQRPAADQKELKQTSPALAPADNKQPAVREESQQVKSKDKKKKKSSRKEEGKKKKRKEKKRKHSVTESSDESDADHKKQRKRKRTASPPAKSSSKVCKSSEVVALKDPEEKRSKKEKREKKRSKHSRRSVSGSDSERVSRKKSKKKKSKKSSQKRRKQRKSSPSSESSASESGSGSEAVTMEIEAKRKKMRDEEKPSVRRSPDGKTSPTTFEFPRSVLLYTQTQPSIQYCRNPRTILLNPADDSPRTKSLPDDPPTRSTDTCEHRSPEKKSTEKTRTSSTSTRRAKGSPPALVEQRSSCDAKKVEDDDHNREKEVSASTLKDNLPGKSKRDDRSADSSRKQARNASPSQGSRKAEPEDKSRLADSVKQELLEKVAQKRKEDGKSEGKDVKVLNDKIVIGKMKQSRKPGRREDKATPLDMNQDYCWYQQHYASSYAMDPYTAAYYAQYAMVTSGDYTNPDISAWLQGYGLLYDPNNTASMPLLPPTDADAAAGDSNQIPVLGKDVPDAAVEQFFQPSDASEAADTRPEEMDVESDDDCPSPPAPPPPPPPPHITNLVVEQAFELPNGQEVPAGTKQVIVHPYPESHPLSSHFTPEFVQSSLQSSKCEDKAGRVVPNGASNSTSVVT